MARFVASVVIQPSGPGLKPLTDEASRAAPALHRVGEEAQGATAYVAKLEGSFAGLKEAVEGIAGLVAFEKLKEGIEKGVEAIIESRAAFAQLEAGVRSTGGAAGFTAEQLREIAETLQVTTGLWHEQIESAERTLLEFPRITGETFKRATRDVLDYSAATGKDLVTASQSLGKALNDPLQNMQAIQRAIGKLSPAQQELIKQFAAARDIEGAQNVVLLEMERRFGGSAQAAHEAKAGLDDLHNAAEELWEQFGRALLPAVSQLAAEFTELAKDPALLQEITDAGHSLGEILLAAGHAAEFLVSHWEILKLAFIAFIALKAPAYILEVVEAVKALTIASRAAALANPLAWVAIGLLAVNDFVVKMRDAEDAALQANVQLGNQSGLVQALTTDYGNLTAAQLENAKAQLDQLQARNRVLQQQREELLQQAGYSQAGQTPGRQAPPSVRNVDKAAVDDLLKKEHELAIEQGNIQNILKNMSPVLEEHEKHLKSTAAATSDWGLKTKATTDKVKEALATAAEALRREQELTEARYKGVDVLKLQTIVLDGLKKAQSLGATATDEQRLAMFRMTVQTEQAKEAGKSYERALKDLDSITKEFLKDSKSLADTMARIRDIGASFLADTLKENQKQVDQGAATMTETVKAHLEEIRKAEEALKEPWISLGQSIQQTLESSVAAALSGVKVDWSNVVRSIWQEFLQTAIHALDEWLKIWIAHMLKAKAAQAAINGGSPGTTTTGVGGGIYQGAFNVASNYATTGSSGISSSAAGGGAVIAAFVVAYFAVKSWIDHHKREFEQFRIIGTESGALSWSLGSATAGIEHLGAVADEMVKTVTGVVRTLGGVLQGWTGDLTVSRTGHGKHTEYWVQYADGLVARFGNDAQAAFEFATIQAIKQAHIGGLPAEVRDAIQKSAATTVEQFQAELAAAYELVTVRLGDVGTKVYEIFRKFSGSIEDAIRKSLTALSAAVNSRPGIGGVNFGGGGLEGGPGSGGLNEKAGGRLPVEAAIEEVKAITDLVAARNREIAAIRNSLLGVDDSGAQRLADIASFNRGIAESRGLVAAQIELVQQQLDSLGDKTGEAADHLRDVLRGYLAELNKIPEAISGQQLDMAIFHVLDEFLPHTRKYDQERVQFARMETDLKFQEIKLQLIALNAWDKWAQVWQDAYNNAMKEAGKPQGGHDGGQNREQAAKDWQSTLQGILDAGTPLIAQWHQLQQSQQDLRDKAKAAHASAAELATGLAALDAQFKASVRAQAYQLAGIGTDFTKSLQDGLDFFKQLKDLGRAKTGIPDWLREVMEGKFLDKMRATWTQGVLQLAGISDPFAQINAQEAELRQNLTALAAATHMTAGEVLAASVALDHAAEMARQSARNALEDKLFEPLKDLPEWQGRIVELKRDELELQYEILKAQLVAAGLWEKDKDVWQASHDASVAALHVSQTQLSAAEREAAIQQDRNTVAGFDLVKAQQDAAAKFLQAAQAIDAANKSLLTDKTLSPLSPEAQRTALLSQYEDTLAKARGGDINALNAYAGVRQQLLDFEKSFSKSGPEYAALFERVFREGAGLVLDQGVEQATVQNLIAQQTAQAADASAQQHADLLAVRSSVIDGLNGLAQLLGQPANILNGVPHFAAGGVATRPSVLGEAGPEAAVPLPDGRSIPVAIYGRQDSGDGGKTAKEVREQGRATVGSIKRLSDSLDKFVTEQRETNAKLSATLNAALRGASLAGGQATVRKAAK